MTPSRSCPPLPQTCSSSLLKTKASTCVETTTWDPFANSTLLIHLTASGASPSCPLYPPKKTLNCQRPLVGIKSQMKEEMQQKWIVQVPQTEEQQVLNHPNPKLNQDAATSKLTNWGWKWVILPRGD